MTTRLFSLTIGILVASFTLTVSTRADDFYIWAEETGGDVVFQFQGSFDVSGLTLSFQSSYAAPNFVQPNPNEFSVAPAGSYPAADYYNDAVSELIRFIKVYPTYKDLGYVYYLLGVTYYEQIVDEKKDLESISLAKKYFEIVIEKYPNTEYAIDSRFKIDLINDILAAKEIYIGRHYIKKKKWIPAINRFKNVLQNYDTTVYVEEAIHRLVEVYHILGMEDESLKYASLLGYNYNSSEWYEETYKIFNKKYKKPISKNKKENSKILGKIKSLF